MLTVLRSLTFYCAFYVGSLGYVLMALALIRWRPAKLSAHVWRWSRFHRDCVTHILGIDVVEHGERADRPVLYALKHESFFEAIDLPQLLDQPVIFAKQELFEIPGWGRVAAGYGAIPVARAEGARALRAMVRSAQAVIGQSRPLAIFPEGTRIPHGTRAPLRSGFAMLYKMLGLPVVPVAVSSGPTYHSVWKRSGRIDIRFGEMIEPGLPRAELEARVLEQINALNSEAETASSAASSG